MTRGDARCLRERIHVLRLVGRGAALAELGELPNRPHAVEHSGMAPRRCSPGLLAVLAVLATPTSACHRDAAQSHAAREEPMRLPFDDFRPSEGTDPYTYQRTLSPGCTLSYQRWWGIPPDPGAPLSQLAVRSARLAGVAAYALVYDVGGGEQRVWRRGDGYQVALAFEGCSPAAADAVLAESEAQMSRPLGAEMPDARSVCVGPRAALELHLATPSRAGAYDPAMPIQGEHLNWTAPGVGCVTYPGLATNVPCGDGSHPWVATTLCQQ